MILHAILLAPLLFLGGCFHPDAPADTGDPVDHTIWDSLVQQHVSQAGLVDYYGFTEDSVRLNAYLELLSDNHPGPSWPRDVALAYWINAYNAFTIRLIIDHYPVASIKDIRRGIPFVNSVWDIKFIEIGGVEYDLNNIEHAILRDEFNEPRIHFAINCAALSCPRLRAEAYRASVLDAQLEEQGRIFLADPNKNQITQDHIRISKIFRWFRGDFTQDGDLIDFLNKYAPVHINDDAQVDYLEYDWSLNDVTSR